MELNSCGAKFRLDDSNVIELSLFREVQNPKDIRKALLAGKLKATVLNASTILDPFQVLVAAHKALLAASQNRMFTKTIYSEIVYNLSISKKISESLNNFGVTGDEKNVIIAVINDDGSRCDLNAVESLIQGRKAELSELSSCSDILLIRKLYDLSDDEIILKDELNCIVTKIATKDVL